MQEAHLFLRPQGFGTSEAFEQMECNNVGKLIQSLRHNFGLVILHSNFHNWKYIHNTLTRFDENVRKNGDASLVALMASDICYQTGNFIGTDAEKLNFIFELGKTLILKSVLWS